MSLKIFAPLHDEIEPRLQCIEVSSRLGIPQCIIVGLPSPEINESKERIQSAISESGLEFPRKRVVINLSPASVKKRGTGLDLPLALAVLGHEHIIEDSVSDRPLSCVAWGELGLQGELKPKGQLGRLLFSLQSQPMDLIILPFDCEAQLRYLIKTFPGLRSAPPAIFCKDLKTAWSALKTLAQKGQYPDSPIQDSPHPGNSNERPLPELLPLSASLLRILAVALAGSHHLLLVGPRGTGKSHALEWLTELFSRTRVETSLSQLFMRELLEPELSLQSMLFQPPIRRVSAHVKPAALIGSIQGGELRPGEFSLAHEGLLLADEFSEWPRDSKEAFREPLERGKITLTFARKKAELPAHFQLIGTSNFCPCGGYPKNLPKPLHDLGENAAPDCSCSARDQELYLARISGVVLDRVDFAFQVFSSKPKAGTSSEDQLEECVKKISEFNSTAEKLWGSVPGRMSPHELQRLLNENPALSKDLASLQCTSLRSAHRILRGALSLALWEGSELPKSWHLREAQMLRPEQLWRNDRL